VTHTVKNSSAETLTFKSTTDSSDQLRPSVIVDSLTTGQFGALGDATVAPGSQGNLLALTRSIHSQIASGITLQASTQQIGQLQPSTNQVGDVGLKARGAGGLSVHYLHSAGDHNLTQVKTTSGTLYAWSLNNSSAAAWLKFFDTTATSSGTTGMSPKFSIKLGASENRDQSVPHGIAFASGIAFALTAAGATNATAGVGASDVDVNLFYA
jgi:hypothetical protein